MKKTVYVILALVLGLLLSFILHAALEIGYIVYAARAGITLVPYLNGSCFLPPVLALGMAVLGILGGLGLGFWWWDLVYVKKRRWKK